MKPIVTLVLVFAAASGLFPGAAAPDALKVTVSGEAAGSGFAAREEAVRNAKKLAVARALESMTSPDSQRFLRPILRRPGEYTGAYNLLSADESASDRVRVEVEVTLIQDRLQRDAAALLLPTFAEPPKVLLVAGEKHAVLGDSAVTDTGVAAKTLTEGLTAARLDVSGIASIADIYTFAQLHEVVWGDIEAGRQFATENLADVVMIATANVTTEIEVEGANVYRHTADVTLRVYRGEDGKLVDALNARAAVFGADANTSGPVAIADACEKLTGGAVTASVLAVASADSVGGVLLTVKNPRTRDRLAEVVSALEAMPNGGAVTPLLYRDSIARMRVDYAGPMPQLAHFILDARYSGAKPALDSSVGRKMTISFP